MCDLSRFWGMEFFLSIIGRPVRTLFHMLKGCPADGATRKSHVHPFIKPAGGRHGTQGARYEWLAIPDEARCGW